MNVLRPITGGSPWPWIWFTVAAALAILFWWHVGAPAPVPDVRVVEREVTRIVPVERVRVEARVDTVIDVRLVKDATDRYFLDKRIREVDSLRRLVREYAAARGDSVEQVEQGDTVLCRDAEGVTVCDTLRYQYLSLSGMMLLDVGFAPRPVRVLEQTVFVDKEIVPLAAKLEWGSYGIIVGALGAYVATRSAQ